MLKKKNKGQVTYLFSCDLQIKECTVHANTQSWAQHEYSRYIGMSLDVAWFPNYSHYVASIFSLSDNTIKEKAEICDNGFYQNIFTFIRLVLSKSHETQNTVLKENVKFFVQYFINI